MNSKSLPFYMPPIYGRLHHGLPLSTISMDNNSFRQWFYSNYIQLSCGDYDGGSFDLNFYEYYMHEHRFPNFHLEQLKKETFRSIISPTISPFLVNCIMHDFYVLTYFDEYFLPLKNGNEKHIIRDCLIIGYDNNKEKFNIVGFKKNGQFGIEEIPYHDLEYAFHNSPDTEAWANYLYLLKPIENTDYTFDIGWVTENIRDYLDSIDNLPNFRLYSKRERHIFGIDTLKKFAHELQEGNIMGNHYIPSHIIWEHKKCMYERFQFIASRPEFKGLELNNYINKLSNIYKDAEVLKNMSLRAYIVKDPALIKRMSAQVLLIRENDITVLNEILEVLSLFQKSLKHPSNFSEKT